MGVKVFSHGAVDKALGSSPQTMTFTSEAMLLVRGGPEEGSKIALSKGTMKLGRTAQNDIVLDQDGVSRRHARIRSDSSGFWISDLRSRNGTFVNGERLGIEPRRLRHLDRIELTENTASHWVFLEPQATTDLSSVSVE